MKVAILTMFNGLDNTYSIVNVVAEHIKMLLEANVSTKILVTENCADSERKGIFSDKRLEWIKIVNSKNGQQFKWYDYSLPDIKVHDTFEEEVNLIAEDFVKNLSDVNFCIMHDIHYQGWHLVHNAAIRKAQQKLPDIKFIAFTHSAPCFRPLKLVYPFSLRFTAMPKTVYAYPTYSGIPALAKQYDVSEGKCKVIYNSIDIISYLCDDVKKINEHIDLISTDILIVYPARLTTGKKFEKVASLAGAIKRRNEISVKVVFCDFPSMDIDSSLYKNLIRKSGMLFGLDNNDMLFTSDIGYLSGIPREAVFDLFSLSNLFICPSYSESFGLTVAEAASKGNFLVLNEAVLALEELGKRIKAYFMRWDARNFGFDTKEHYKPNELFYLEEHGANIVNQMRDDRVLHAKTFTRQKLNPKWVWYNQLEPLLE